MDPTFVLRSILLGLAFPICVLKVSAFVTNETCSDQHLSTYLIELTRNYSDISRLTSIGKSVDGQDLLVMIISDHPNVRPLLRPQVKFVGNIMGNTGPSCYILLRLIEHLLTNYETEDSLERRLIQSTEIHILPNMNPDGYKNAVPGKCGGSVGKFNGGGKVLNRDFPFIFDSDSIEEDYRQPETEAVMDWTAANNFVTSISFFAGAKVVSYPFDAISSKDLKIKRGQPNLTPDNDIFQYLTNLYVSNVEDLHDWHCPRLEKIFHNGIINGAEWMPASGTMMDYNYIVGTPELLVGISCCRNEYNEDELEKMWINNERAMLRMIQELQYAFRGQVLDNETNSPIQNAMLMKLHPNTRFNKEVQPWYTSFLGEFWRLSRHGTFMLEVTANGYKKKTVSFEVRPFEATEFIVKLNPEKPKVITKRFNPSTSTILEVTSTSTTLEPELESELQNDAAHNSKEIGQIRSIPEPILAEAINFSVISVNQSSEVENSTMLSSENSAERVKTRTVIHLFVLSSIFVVSIW